MKLNFITLLIFLLATTQLSLSQEFSFNCKKKRAEVTCTAQNDPIITTESVTINILLSGTDESVHVVEIINKTIHYLPSGLETRMGGLLRLEVNQCGLKEISAENLKPFESLTELILPGNDITALNAKLFEFNDKIQELDLSNNKIKTIHPDVFGEKNKIDHFSIVNNYCYSGEFKEQSTRDIIGRLDIPCWSHEALRLQLEKIHKEIKDVSSTVDQLKTITTSIPVTTQRTVHDSTTIAFGSSTITPSLDVIQSFFADYMPLVKSLINPLTFDDITVINSVILVVLSLLVMLIMCCSCCCCRRSPPAGDRYEIVVEKDGSRQVMNDVEMSMVTMRRDDEEPLQGRIRSDWDVVYRTQD